MVKSTLAILGLEPRLVCTNIEVFIFCAMEDKMCESFGFWYMALFTATISNNE